MSELKKIFEEFKNGQKIFGDDIARLINVALLTVVYIVGVGASWIITRFGKKELLELDIEPKSKTYWKNLNLGKRPIKEHYRQF